MSRSEPQSVYVCGQTGGSQKIGVSDNVPTRVSKLGMGLQYLFHIERPFGDARYVERVAHAILKEKLVPGTKEWFAVTGDEAVGAVKQAVALVDTGLGATVAPAPYLGIPRTITLPISLWDEIISLRHDMRVTSQAEAFRRILVAGIEAIRRE